MKKLLGLLGMLFCAAALFARKPVVHTADLDRDGVRDTMWYSHADSLVTFRLSSRGFEPYYVDYFMGPQEPHDAFISVEEGGFDIILGYRMNWERLTYEYDPDSGRFRLANYWTEDNSNAPEGGGYGEMSLDLRTSEFTGDWSYFNEEFDAVVELPTAYAKVHNRPVYFGDGMNFVFPGFVLYESYKEAYEPPHTDTLKFVGFLYDWDFPTLVCEDEDGERYHDLVCCSYEEFYQGDLLSLTTSINIYEEPGDGMYYASMMIGDIEVVEAGPLRRFHETNTKAIDYRDDSQYAERWDPRRLDGIDWFIATSGNKLINKYLRKPGKLWVTFHDHPTHEDDYSVWFLTEISNEDNGMEEPVLKLLMEMYDDLGVRYYLLDDKTGELTQLDI